MCYSLYLFTDTKLETIPFDEHKPGMHIKEIKPLSNEPALKWKDGRKYAYYAGSRMECGCGWIPADVYEEEEEEIEEIKKDRNSLYVYLKKYKPEGAFLIIAWEGTQGLPLEGERIFNPEQLKDPYFEFEELIKYTVN